MCYPAPNVPGAAYEHAQQPRIIRAVRAEMPPVIDGTVDELKEWNATAAFEGLVDAFSGEKAPEQAKFWLEYDDRYLYFAAKLQDAFPKTIRAREYRTNVSLEGEDEVSVQISPSGNLADFDSVEMNANGATNVTLAGGTAVKREWIGEILAKGRITGEGWEVEARIPWRLFRLPKPGKHDMRLNVRRDMPRTSRVYALAYTFGAHRDATPVWSGVDVPVLGFDRSIKVLPYGYLGYDADARNIANAGVDVKTNLTQTVTLVGSVNPDFRDVENQILSLDFSRFARLAGESRPFFQEGSGYWSSNIFESQVIPAFDIGVNVYGKLGPRTQFGVLETTSLGKQEDLVAKATVTPDPRDALRFAATHLSEPGDENEASLVSWTHSFGDFRLTAAHSQTIDTLQGRGESDSAVMLFTRPGMISRFNLQRVTPNYDPGLGFEPEVNYQGAATILSFSKNLKSGPFIDNGVFFGAQSYERVNGVFYRDSITANGYLLLRNQLLLSGALAADRFVDDQDHTFSFTAQYPESDARRRVTLTATSGTEEEQSYNNFALNGAYRFNRRFSTNISYQVVKLGQSYQDQVILSGNCDVGHDRYLSARLVQLPTGTNCYLSFNQSGNRGLEYFLIIGNPNAPVINNSNLFINVRTSIILKVVAPFQIGSTGSE